MATKIAAKFIARSKAFNLAFQRGVKRNGPSIDGYSSISAKGGQGAKRADGQALVHHRNVDKEPNEII